MYFKVYVLSVYIEMRPLYKQPPPGFTCRSYKEMEHSNTPQKLSLLIHTKKSIRHFHVFIFCTKALQKMREHIKRATVRFFFHFFSTKKADLQTANQITMKSLGKSTAKWPDFMPSK